MTYKIPVGSGDIELNAVYYYNGRFYSKPDKLLHQSNYNIVNASMTRNLPRLTSLLTRKLTPSSKASSSASCLTITNEDNNNLFNLRSLGFTQLGIARAKVTATTHWGFDLLFCCWRGAATPQSMKRLDCFASSSQWQTHVCRD